MLPLKDTMATKLVDLEIDEVSCVDAGANPHAAIVLAKRATKMAGPFTLAKASGVMFNQENSLTALQEDVCQALREKFGGTNPNAQDYWLYVRDLFETTVIFDQAGETWRADYTATTGADGEMKIELGDRIEVQMLYQDAPTQKAKELGTGVAATRSKGDTVEKTVEELQAELKKANDGLAAVEELKKRATETETELAKVKSEAAAEKVEAQKRIDEVTKQAKVEKDARRLVELAKMADDKIPNLKGTSTEKGTILKSLEDNLPPDDLPKVMELLEAGSVAMGKQFSPVGRGGDIATGSALEKLHTLAKARQTEKGIPWAKALDQVSRENPDLYMESRERRAN